jgi:23S rRNA (cytosine1962-C5)-methyltransferase
VQYSRLVLKRAEYQRIPAGYPWIYSNQIDTAQTPLKSVAAGEIVDLYFQDNWLARGYANPHSLIAFRILTWEPEEEIDQRFFEKRFKKALALRESFYTEPYYRLIHAEGDFIPGLIIDRYNDVFVVQLNTAGVDKLSDLISAALQTLFTPKTIIIKRDSPSRLQEGLTQEAEQIIGEPISECIIKENNAQFAVSFSEGQKTGWFFDQRHNRLQVAELCQGKSVIDYYCYAGGFGVLAATMGATSVIEVDRSATALAQAKKAAQLNHVEQKCEFVCTEAFSDIEQRIERREQYDVVIADPPAFIKSRKDKPQGLKGYQKLMQGVLQLVKPEGYLFIASCSYHISVEEFKECLQKAFAKNGMTGQILAVKQAGMDHPVQIQLAETDYLKGLLVRVIS